jgi:hypothetical protein
MEICISFLSKQTCINCRDRIPIAKETNFLCYQFLVQMAEHDRSQLIWVPDHERTDGKEMADQLAKLRSERPLIGPEPACSIAMGVAKKAVRDWTTRDHRNHWNSSCGLEHAKTLVQGPSDHKVRELLGLNRNQPRRDYSQDTAT